MKRALGVLVGVIVLAMAGSAPAAPKKAFADWVAVVVAGDYAGAHGEGDTEAFDNARRDVAKALVERMGFAPANVREFSVRPERYTPRPGVSTLFNIQNNLQSLASKAKGGCLFYYTSHGAQYGAFLNAANQEDGTIIFPTVMAELINSACPGRPTIVVISTCFSGVNLPAVQKDDRLVMTAARRDRSSFGCGQQNTYPYFDQCFLESAQAVNDFAALPAAVGACVSRMERETGMSPPSEPQVWIGSAIKPLLPLYAFPKGG
jgi:hypothetical protein